MTTTRMQTPRPDALRVCRACALTKPGSACVMSRTGANGMLGRDPTRATLSQLDAADRWARQEVRRWTAVKVAPSPT